MIVKPLDRGLVGAEMIGEIGGRCLMVDMNRDYVTPKSPLATVYKVPVLRETLVERNVILVVMITGSTSL